MELKVFITNRDSTCDECGEHLGYGAWITLVEEKGALCLSCADLDHLIFLPSGDAAADPTFRQVFHVVSGCSEMEPRPQTLRTSGIAGGRVRAPGAPVLPQRSRGYISQSTRRECSFASVFPPSVCAPKYPV